MQVGGTAQELHHNALRWEPAAHVQRLGRAARRTFEPFAPGGFWYCTVMSRDFSHSPMGRQVREARPPRRPRLGSQAPPTPPRRVAQGVPATGNRRHRCPRFGEGSPANSTARAGETYPPRFASPRGVRHDQGGLRRNIDGGRLCREHAPRDGHGLARAPYQPGPSHRARAGMMPRRSIAVAFNIVLILR
jgi:hypothetical protein